MSEPTPTPENPTTAELKTELETTELDSLAQQVEGRLGKNPAAHEEE